MIKNLKCDRFHWSAWHFNNMQISLWSLFIPMSFVWPTMLHIKKLMGMHNKGTYKRVLTYAYTRIDICVYAKYERIIRVCIVRIYLSLLIQRHHLLKLDIIENKPTILWLPTGSPCLSILKNTKVNLSLSKTSKWLPVFEIAV